MKYEEQVSRGWRTAAIVFIILFAVETLAVGIIIYKSIEVYQNENECGVNLCEKYEKYYYDAYEKLCHCYIDDEIIWTEDLS